MKFQILRLLVFGLAIVPVTVFSQSVPLTQDSYVTNGSTQNNGAASTLNVDSTLGSNALVQFDLSALPAGLVPANIFKATLTLFTTKVSTSGNVNIFVANGPWSETAVNGNNAPVAGTSVASGVAVPATNRFLTVDVTAAVQSWLNGVANNGFLIEPAGTVSVEFDSKESTTTSHSATLNIFLTSTPTATISSLSPASVASGSAGFTVTVSGSGYVAGSVVSWNGSTVEALATTFVNSTKLTAAVPASLISGSGSANIVVQNPGGSQSNLAVFTVVGPAVSSISPVSTVAGSPDFTLSVTGTGFATGSTVSWNAGSTPVALATALLNSTQLTATVPASLVARPGTASLTVQNSGAGQSSATVFSISAPAVTSLSPISTPAGSAPIVITLKGSGFLSGSTVQWSAGSTTTNLSTTFVSATQMTAVVPVNLTTAPGSASIGVMNPGGSASNSSAFSIGAVVSVLPSISSLSPASAAAGSSALTITINGSGFVANSAVLWKNGSAGSFLSVTVVSPTQITAVVPASLLAKATRAASVAVQNPGGLNSGALAFTVN